MKRGKNVTKRTLAVKNAVAPSEEFVALSVRVMYEGDYNQARKRLTIADLTSDLQTETEDEDNSKRKKRPYTRFVLDDTDDTDGDDDEHVESHQGSLHLKKPQVHRAHLQ